MQQREKPILPVYLGSWVRSDALVDLKFLAWYYISLMSTLDKKWKPNYVSCFWVSDQIDGFDVKRVDEYHLTGMESTLFVGWEHRPAPPSEGRGDNRGKPEAKRSADKMEKKGKHASGKVTARCDHFLVQTVLYRQKNNDVCFPLGSSDIGWCRGCVSGSALVGAPAFLHAGVCAGGTHHQHPSERAVATGTEELASPPARHRG